MENFSFQSSCTDWRVHWDEQGQKYVQYKITCRVQLQFQQGEKSLDWVCWRRYREFLQLNTLLLALDDKDFGCRDQTVYLIDPRLYVKRLKKLKFPPKHDFSTECRFGSDFCVRRMNSLQEWWESLEATCGRLFDFNDPHRSRVLKGFLDFDNVVWEQINASTVGSRSAIQDRKESSSTEIDNDSLFWSHNLCTDVTGVFCQFHLPWGYSCLPLVYGGA